ncbi:S41 family peptidase [Pseudotenacibaculum sp. MALMAid0570]|uniref:S41 family peptidase n=1 Tax=Pseudotenacibaculum sp. MALMAid0570 TaxID=3143938 RepID=UPI0032DF87FD
MRRVKVKKYQVIILLIGVVLTTYSFKSKFFEVAKQLEIYTTLYKELNMYYVNEINPAEFTDKAIKNTLKDLDPYTNYYDEQEVEEARIRREGEYAGIGVSVYYDEKGITLAEIYKGYEADKKGLKAGDIITKVDGQPIQNMESDELSQFLKGAPNSSVNIEVDRQGKLMNLTVVREKVVVNPVPYYDMIDNETGYIVLTRFNEKASSEVKKAFKALKDKGMKKLVFDLRSNPGGSLLEAINISNFFLPKGSTIVSTKAKVKKWSNTYRATNKPLDLEIPVAVLVNDRSASASEIVSGALQDFDRAVVLGERSFGKGLVQRYRQLTYGTQLKVTISKYYTPSGRCIQELDYANRDENGKVPKFSDGTVTAYKTKNGRTVYDGGGVQPDIVVGFSERTEATKELIKTRAIFNFVTDFTIKNPTISAAPDFTFNQFNKFQDYILTTDTSFKTVQEKMFLKAYESLESEQLLSKEYQQIKKKLNKNKVEEISKNRDYISNLIQNEILSRYYFKEGSYQNKLKKDKVVLKAVDVLKDTKQYSKILSGA